MKSLNPDERQIQESMVQWLHTQEKLSRLRFFHVPNEGRRHPAVGKRLKKLGLRAGVPDLCIIFADGHTWWVEVKSEKGTVNNLQRWWLDWLGDRKHHSSFIVRSLDELRSAITQRFGVYQ